MAQGAGTPVAVRARPSSADRRTRGKVRRVSLASLLALLAALIVTSSGPAAAASAAVLRHGPRDARRVALTFDDGWSPERCARVIAVLRASRTPATFFINGVHLRRSPDLWRRLLEGFEVANHTRSHPFLTQLDAARIRRQIRSNELIHERVLHRPMLRVLRPPYGAYDLQVLRVAAELGYRHVLLWDTSSGDTSPRATIASVTRHASRGGRGSVVLLHCGPAPTAHALAAVISSYRDRGFELVTVSQLLGSAAWPSGPVVGPR
jgi:peptidoglycan/xylan/chitin deacetylase (PgdA/CDA1 family)